MKRIKLFMLSAAIVAAGSAFIPAETPPGDVYVKVGNDFLLKSTQQGRCKSGTTVCEYILREDHGAEPYTINDFDFDPNEQQVWSPTP
jgi:hypothetical protein